MHASLQSAPFLRGEWNAARVGLLAPAEARIALAVDAMLGAVPFWFKVGWRAGRNGSQGVRHRVIVVPERLWMGVPLPAPAPPPNPPHSFSHPPQNCAHTRTLTHSTSPHTVQQGPEAAGHHLAIGEALAGGGALDAARGLLGAESFLSAEGALEPAWADAWQLPWRR